MGRVCRCLEITGYHSSLPPEWNSHHGCASLESHPLGILALVQELGAGIRAGMVIVNPDTALDRDSVAVAPGETLARPVEVGAVPIGNEHAPRHWNMKHGYRF